MLLFCDGYTNVVVVYVISDGVGGVVVAGVVDAGGVLVFGCVVVMISVDGFVCYDVGFVDGVW